MPKPPTPDELPRRERQLLDLLHRLEQATPDELLAALPDPPSNAAVRFTLRTLVDKGLASRARDGRGYVYSPAASPRSAQRSALRGVVETFFAGSTSRAVASLLEDAKGLSPDELQELRRLIERARKEGR